MTDTDNDKFERYLARRAIVSVLPTVVQNLSQETVRSLAKAQKEVFEAEKLLADIKGRAAGLALNLLEGRLR